MARSAKILDKCRNECAKDLDKQVRCQRNCEGASDRREKGCKKPQS